MRSSVLLLLAIVLFSCKNERQNNKPGICLSFDDRAINEWFQLRSFFSENNVRVTFFITQPDSLSETEIQQLKTLQQDGHEIGFHGSMHVVSEYYIKQNSYNEYLTNEIENGLFTMDSLGFTCTAFAYPFGSTYWFTDYLLLKKFKHIRTVSPLNRTKDLTKIDDIFYAFDGDHTHSAVGLDGKTGISKEMIDEALDRVLQNKEVLMLYGHAPAAKTEVSEYDFQLELLRYIIEKAQEKELGFYRFQDL